MASGRHVGFGLTSSRGVRWRQKVVSRAHNVVSGATYRRRMWRQNVASLADVASGSCVASPDVASKKEASLNHLASWSHVASTDVASECRVACSCGVRELHRVAGCGVRTGRQALWTDVASRGGVITCRREVRGTQARVFSVCLHSSGDRCTPTCTRTGTPLLYVVMSSDPCFANLCRQCCMQSSSVSCNWYGMSTNRCSAA